MSNNIKDVTDDIVSPAIEREKLKGITQRPNK